MDKFNHIKIKKILALSSILIGNLFASVFAAAPVAPPNIPLETGGAVGTKPNIMFILDDSGSMGFHYLGDEIKNANNCTTIDNGTVKLFSTDCDDISGTIDIPTVAYSFNKITYNPNITYKPGITYDGVSLGNQSLTSAKKEPYTSPSTAGINLTTTLKETYYCKINNPTALELADNSKCRRNGIDTVNPFNYYTQAYPNATYQYPVSGPVAIPFYITINATDYCDINGVNCSSSSSSGIAFPVRWCLTAADASGAAVPTGKFTSGGNNGKVKCQEAYVSGTYKYVRFGTMTRTNITAGEYTNYANWYSYYRYRMQAMKTSVGLAFASMDSTRRVGFITINPGTIGSTTSKFLPIRDFTSGTTGQKKAFYDILYKQPVGNSTPLREALSRVGQYYAGNTDNLASGMITGSWPDPVQFSCQQNFTILSTDGYWNGNAGQKIDGSSVGNQDNNNSGYTSRTTGAYDGAVTNATDSLADVAAYYYKTDLRPTGSLGAGGVDVSENNVPISPTDQNTSQHMVTYAIALGMNGFVKYTKDYTTGGNTDFENIKNGTSGACAWATGVCNWPLPKADTNSAIDDLWHAAINGRGKYFSAQNTTDIVEGLSSALSSLVAQVGASASAATSSPNITSTDNYLFYSTYRTVNWDGEIAAKTIDPNTGAVSATPLWSAQALLNTKTTNTTDTRTIYFNRNGAGTSALVNFDYSSMNATEKAYFNNKCTSSTLSQCATLDATNKALVDSGTSLVNFLRGQRGYEKSTNIINPLYRDRAFILGDIVDTSPVFVGTSSYSFLDSGYTTYATGTASRDKALYVGANDGMIHSINPLTGQENWGIIPSQVLSKMWKLSDYTYQSSHEFYVDGTLSVMDVKIGTNWKTVLIAGMGPGGKGYIAIDITVPNAPVVLWEICTTSVCSVTDANDMGYSYGNPIITKRYYDSKWVAYLPAGYDNASGKGIVFEVDIANGTVLRKLVTGTGTTASPAGVAKINTYYETFNTDNKAKYMYAGDMDGQVWKWDLTSSSNTLATNLGATKDALGNVQPITTKVELGFINGFPVVFFGTGSYLNFADYSTTGTQSFYAVKDNGTNFGNIRNNPDIVAQTMTTGGTTNVSSSSNAVDWDHKSGWYFDFKAQAGERMNIDPTLALGTLNIISNIPGATTCTAGGNAWAYQVDFYTGSAVTGGDGFIGHKLTGGLVVGQVVVRLSGSGGLKNFITDASGTVTPTGVQINNGISINTKSSWREVHPKK